MLDRIVVASLCGGVTAGVLDMLYACIHYGLAFGDAPRRVFQYVAAGLLGREQAMTGGWASANLGLGLHFAIATAMAGFYVAAGRFAPILNKRPLLMGVATG